MCASPLHAVVDAAHALTSAALRLLARSAPPWTAPANGRSPRAGCARCLPLTAASPCHGARAVCACYALQCRAHVGRDESRPTGALRAAPRGRRGHVSPDLARRPLPTLAHAAFTLCLPLRRCLACCSQTCSGWGSGTCWTRPSFRSTAVWPCLRWCVERRTCSPACTPSAPPHTQHCPHRLSSGRRGCTSQTRCMTPYRRSRR